jgi:hypothetical protein
MDRSGRPTPDDAPRFIAHLAPAIHWLRDHRIPSAHIAHAFHIRPDRVRQIDHRRPRRARESWAPPTLSGALTARIRASLGLRRLPDDADPSPRQVRRVATLLDDIAAIRQQHRSAYRFLDGAAELRLLVRRIGNPSQVGLLRARAACHREIAWFSVHSGRAQSAWSEASDALQLSYLAHRHSGRRDDLRAMMDSALIGSLACLLTQRADDALRWLELYEDLSEPAGSPLGSEFYRQRGTALFQRLAPDIDGATRRQFERAAHVMEARGELTSPVQLLMTGPRQRLLLEPFNEDAAQDLLTAVGRAYPRDALEPVMAAHWTAAAAFATDSPVLHDAARRDVQRVSETALPYGHQASINFLLQRTPDLALPHQVRSLWVRYLLYANAYRDD